MTHVVEERYLKRSNGKWAVPSEGCSVLHKDGHIRITCWGNFADRCGIQGTGSTYEEALAELWAKHPTQMIIE